MLDQTTHTGILKRMKPYRYLYGMLLPVLVWYVIFCYIPMYGVIISFEDYSMGRGVLGSPFVGLKHFAVLMEDRYFWSAFRNTLIIAAYRIILVFPLPIALALLLNEIPFLRMKKYIQTAMYLPHFLSWVIAASIVIAILSPDTGLVDGMYKLLGKEMPLLLTNPKAFRSIVVISEMWKESGWNTIIFMATIAGIDISQYEAAYADGAGRWKRMWHITLPGIRSTIAVMLILTVGQVMSTGFDQIFNLYNARVYETGDIIDTYVFRTVLSDYKLSYAAATGLFKSVIGALLLFTTNFASRKITNEGIF